MTKEEILHEVVNSKWQPEFEFTDDLDDVVDSILKPHEDYLLNLHDKVKEIIKREILYFDGLKNQNPFYPEYSDYKITFEDICNWQKELFEHKKRLINNIQIQSETYQTTEEYKKMFPALYEYKLFADKVKNLPNQYINLGLRKINVKVGDWTPPHPMFLEDLKEMCFPVSINNDKTLLLDNICKGGSIQTKEQIVFWLTKWYKIFETIYFFEDLNGRIGGIVIKIFSFLLTGKYIKKKDLTD